MKPSDFISGKQGLDFSSAIENMIKQSCIIDFGIVQNIVADGVVDVSVAVSKTAQDMVCMTCVLANIASSNFTLKVVPKKGDRVLVVYPRIFSDTMFNVEGDETKDTKIVVDKDAKGYNLASGIAVLLNQYKSNAHESVLTFDEDITFARGNTQLVLNKDDETTFTQNDVQITINKDSEISVTNGKADITVDKDGNVTIDSKNGKICLKNNDTSLYDILSGMLEILNTSLATAGSPASHTVVPQQFASQSTQLGQLMQ